MWNYLLLAAFVLVAVLVFVRLSSLRYRSKPLIGLFPRIVIALFFPFIGLVIILLGSFIVVLIASLVVLLLLIMFLVFLFARPKIYVFKKKF